MGTMSPPPGASKKPDAPKPAAPRKRVPIRVHVGPFSGTVDGNEEVTARTVGGVGLFVLMVVMLVIGGGLALVIVGMAVAGEAPSGGATLLMLAVAALPLYVGIRLWSRLRRSSTK